MRIAVLADTHIPKRAKTLPDKAWALLKSADAILHAGDVMTSAFLSELTAVAPLHVVRGNNDIELLRLPEILELTFENVSIALIHDSGQKMNRAARMRKQFPKADIVVFGHSHIPMNEYADGLLLFNPGSPTDRRKEPNCTMGILELSDGKILSSEIVVV